MTKQERRDEAREAYKAISGPAWKAYKAINDPAFEAYEAINGSAWKAYRAKIREIEATEDIIEVDGKRYQLIK